MSSNNNFSLNQNGANKRPAADITDGEQGSSSFKFSARKSSKRSIDSFPQIATANTSNLTSPSNQLPQPQGPRIQSDTADYAPSGWLMRPLLTTEPDSGLSPGALPGVFSISAQAKPLSNYTSPPSNSPDVVSIFCVTTVPISFTSWLTL